jgi:hypothetical protein
MKKLVVEVADKCIEMGVAKVRVCNYLRYAPQEYWCHLLNSQIQDQAINRDCECVGNNKFAILEETK